MEIIEREKKEKTTCEYNMYSKYYNTRRMHITQGAEIIRGGTVMFSL